MDKGEIRVNKAKRGWEDPTMVVSEQGIIKKARMALETTMAGREKIRKERGKRRPRGETKRANEPGGVMGSKLWNWIMGRLDNRKKIRGRGMR